MRVGKESVAGLVVGLVCTVLLGRCAEAQQQTWKAGWIKAPFSTEQDGALLDGSRPMPVFRRSFVLRQRPVKAQLVIAGLGQYEAHLNGAKVGTAALAQAWTDYRKTVTFDTYDVTAQLRQGENVMGVLLGNGMYNVQRTKGRYTKFEGSYGPPKLIAELRLEYPGRRTETIVTDSAWQAGPGPVRFSSTYGGEDFDAREVPAHWDVAGDVDLARWKAAEQTQGPGGNLTPALAPLVVEHEHHEGKLIMTFAAEGASGKREVYDFGQNLAGWPRLIVHGPAGATVRILPGELLKADGTVSQASSGGPQWWSYTIRGEAHESWQPHFSYYGFRYAQVEWTGGEGTVERAESVEVHTAAAQVGTFASSNETLNKIHALIVAAMHNNEVSVLTDCPHREKLGWLEQDHLIAPGLLFNDDVRGLYSATERNMADTQSASGMVPTIAPQYTRFGPKYAIYDDSPEWGSAAVLGPWWVYRFTGDRAPLEQNYPVMARWVKYLESRAENGIVSYGLGDWYDIGPNGPGFSKLTTTGVTGTLMLYESANVMQQIATLLGKTADASAYEALARKTADAFQQRFWDGERRWYDKGSETASAMPLALGIVPEAERGAVLHHVLDDIKAHGDHITTGEVGFPYLLRALMQAGRNDVVLRLLLEKTPPSYAAQLEAGATSLTEAWDANPKSSQDHFMLGGAEEWFYRGLAGIDLDLSRAPREQLVVRPYVPARLDSVRGEYASVMGKIASDWRRDGAKTTFDISVPIEATVVLPSSSDGSDVSVAGSAKMNQARGVLRVERGAQETRLRVAPGTYQFVMRDVQR